MKIVNLRLFNLPSMHEATYINYRKQLKRFEIDMHKPYPNTLYPLVAVLAVAHF